MKKGKQDENMKIGHAKCLQCGCEFVYSRSELKFRRSRNRSLICPGCGSIDRFDVDANRVAKAVKESEGKK